MGVTINDIHSDDFGLYMTDFFIEAPSAQTYSIKIPGRNGSLDLTEAFGDIKYNNRKIKLMFKRKDDCAYDWHKTYSKILELWNGKQVKIIFDAEKDYYYLGRANVSNTKQDQIHSTISVTIDCEPYAYEVQNRAEQWLWDPFNFETGKIYQSEYSEINVNGSVDFTFNHNGQMPVAPTFRLHSGICSVIFEGTAYELSLGTNIIPEIVIRKNGTQSITFTGSEAAVSIDYRGGKL